LVATAQIGVLVLPTTAVKRLEAACPRSVTPTLLACMRMVMMNLNRPEMLHCNMSGLWLYIVNLHVLRRRTMRRPPVEGEQYV
jgi:hypothetical protein